MDSTTRSDRAQLVKHILELNHNPGSPYPPAFALWQAAPAAYISRGAAEFARQDMLSAAVRRDSFGERMAAANTVLQEETSLWLSLNEESTPEMFMLELPHADWPADADTPGYISRYTTGRMLDHYASTGAVVWTAHGDALMRLCQTSGTIRAAWQPQPCEGLSPPGTERTAIIRFTPDTAAAAWHCPLDTAILGHGRLQLQL